MTEDSQTSSENRDEAARILAAGDASEVAYLSAGQRRVNIVWEITQSIIALTVVIANVAAQFVPILGSRDHLSSALFLVIGFYFGRTNHQRVGGVIVGR